MSRPAGDEPKKASVVALVRGLRVLQCFDRPGAELTVSEIARRTGLSQPTAWRLCGTLIDCGFLVKAPTGSALRVGAPALTLGYAAIQGQDLPAIARPYMAQVAARMGATVTLGLSTGLDIVSVDQVDGDFVVANRPVGWRAPMTSIPSGLAILAVMPEFERQQILASIATQDPEAWPRRRDRIETARVQLEADGYVSLVMMRGQYAAVSVPLIEGDTSRGRYWTLSCGGLQSQWPPEALTDAARQLKDIRALIQPAAAILGATAA